MNGTSFYRYRRIEQLLGKHRELESQEIYFASPDKLNDPMEGFQDVFWEGDHILWKNLVKHYILCLSQAVMLVHTMGPDFLPKQVTPVLHWSASTLPTPILKEHHERICSAFFAERGVADCIRLLAKVRTRVRREELAFYLSGLHSIALHHIMARLRESGHATQAELLPDGMVEKATQNIRNFLSAVERGQRNGEKVLPFLFDSGIRAAQQLWLLQLFMKGDQVNKGWRFLSFEFTDFYCINVQSTLYPSWYAACFAGNPTHAGMWAHYGGRHEGVCLKFRAEKNTDGVPIFTLNGAAGRSSGSDGTSKIIEGERKLPLWKINYAKSFPKIDFFRSLGRLPIPVLNKDWYSDSGEFSETGRSVFADGAAWRDIYWNNLKLVTTTKFDDWRYEDEYRLVVNPLLDNTLEEGARTFQYNFPDLEGIIFGMNTSTVDKLRIMKIIEHKCIQSGRKEFEFLQANYSSGTSSFDVFRLRLIKLI